MPHSSPTPVAVIDDEEPIRRALRRLLNSSGYDVTLFASGPGFLDSLAGSRPACLILDLHMPQMDGLSILEQLGKIGVVLPVIVITGFDTPKSKDQVLAAGASAYLRKPIDGQQLINAIEEVTR